MCACVCVCVGAPAQVLFWFDDTILSTRMRRGQLISRHTVDYSTRVFKRTRAHDPHKVTAKWKFLSDIFCFLYKKAAQLTSLDRATPATM